MAHCMSIYLACGLTWVGVDEGRECDFLNPTSRRVMSVFVIVVQISSKVSSGFWTLVDMASGRYLWKGMKSLEGVGEKKAAW